MTLSVLVVCLGNICRSPMGEAVLKHEAAKRGIDIEVDSAGTGAYHVGEDPDDRTISTCKKHNIPIVHSARQVKEADFTKFQYILAADESNLRHLLGKKPREGTAVVRLWGSYLDDKPISDPYYGGIVKLFAAIPDKIELTHFAIIQAGFERCFEECTKFSKAFLDEVTSKN